MTDKKNIEVKGYIAKCFACKQHMYADKAEVLYREKGDDVDLIVWRCPSCNAGMVSMIPRET